MRAGPKLILDALDAAVGPAGTLMMVLGTDYPHGLGQHAAGGRAGGPARRHRAVRSRPSAGAVPEVGWLAEAFRRRPGTLVSDNPSGRFGARGAGAEALMRGQPWHDYYGPGSPLEKLCDLGGRILRLGADPETVTALHYAEYLADLPDKRRTRWDYVLAGDGRARAMSGSTASTISDGIVALGRARIISPLILKAYPGDRPAPAAAASAPRDSELIDAADIVDFGARWMEAHLGLVPPAQADPQRPRRRALDDAGARNAGDHARVGEILGPRLDRQTGGQRQHADRVEGAARRGCSWRLRSSSYWLPT